MPCNNFKNCLHQIPLDINQKQNDIDQLTCMTNTLLQSLAASCSTINIDYNNLIACNQTKINSMPLPANGINYINTLANCKYGQGPSTAKTDFINRAANAFKTFAFFASSGASGLKVPIKCPGKTYTNPCDPRQCYVTIKYKVNSQSYRNHKHLIDSLCSTGPIMTDLDTAVFPPNFEDWLKSVQDGTITGAAPYVYTMPPRWVRPRVTPSCASLLKTKHAIVLVGGKCVTINGQDYIEYIFKDTYANNGTQVSWTLRIPAMDNIPFNPGMGNPYTSMKITSATVTNCVAASEDAKACCDPTPTPTQTRAPTPTPTKTRSLPTSTPTPSKTNSLSTPTPTPTKTKSLSTSTPTPTPTKTKALSTPTPTRSYNINPSMFNVP
jgi:hypothetical protein